MAAADSHAGVSARHLSFVETGRSKPGRDMLLAVAEQLQIPFRERNQLLLAAGHAPAFPERPLADPGLAPVREALDRILAAHEPYPAVVFDRAWNLVAAHTPMTDLASTVEIDPALLEPPINLLRTGLHPRGFEPPDRQSGRVARALPQAPRPADRDRGRRGPALADGRGRRISGARG